MTAQTSVRPSPLQIALRLGRVSNLPTVFTNVAAGLALAGARPISALLLTLGIAISLFYVGGMYLNDAFDARWDATNRPERPIPSGHVKAATVTIAGFAMLGAGAVVVAAVVDARPSLWAALALGGLIVLYDLSHKGNPAAPLVMALCRVAVYAVAALAVGPFPPAARVYVGAAALLVYLVFLSTLARKETLHPKLPKMIGSLVAGISLLDAVLLIVCGRPFAAVVCVAAFFLTRALQRSVPGS